MSKNKVISLVIIFIVVVIFISYFILRIKVGNFSQLKLSQPLTVTEPSLLSTSSPVIVSDISNLTSTGDIQESTSVQLQIENLIFITDSHILPSILTLNKNDKVTWINNSNNSVWLTSLVYLTSSVKCGPDIFDSCKEIKPKEKWSFTFSKVGKWEYYDRFNPSLRGKIIVK